MIRDDETIVEHGGSLDVYLAEPLDPTKSLDAQFPCLVGMVPHEGEPIVLPAVEMRNDCWVDVHITSTAGGTSAIFLDATKQVLSHRMLQQKVNDLAILLDKQEKIDRRLQMEQASAAELQQALAPASGVRVAGASFAWAVQAAHPLCGDLAEVFRLARDHVGLYLLDVAGRGTAAANRGIAVSKVLADRAKGHSLVGRDDASADEPGEGTFSDPVNVIKKLGLMFPVHRETGQFFCLFYGILNPSTRQFQYVSAGTRGFIHLPKDGEPKAVQVPGYPLGATTSPEYQKQTVDLKAGDRVILYSDGVVEALSPTSERFTPERLISLVTKSRNNELRDSVAEISREVNEWTNESLHGDVSILAFELDS